MQPGVHGGHGVGSSLDYPDGESTISAWPAPGAAEAGLPTAWTAGGQPWAEELGGPWVGAATEDGGPQRWQQQHLQHHLQPQQQQWEQQQPQWEQQWQQQWQKQAAEGGQHGMQLAGPVDQGLASPVCADGGRGGQRLRRAAAAAAATAGASPAPARTRRSGVAKSSQKAPRPPGKPHPNLIYVQRFRARQKQMMLQLQETAQTLGQQLQSLQDEQRQLCTKWEALEHVLQVQCEVLQLMQQVECQLHISSPREHAPHPEPPAQEEGSGSSGGESASASGGGSAGGSRGVVVRDGSSSSAAATSEPRLADPLQDRAVLLDHARNWLAPVRLYTLRAALMLESYGQLPDTPPARAALAAARACPRKLCALARSPTVTAEAVAAAVRAAAAGEAGSAHAAATAAAAAVASAVHAAWDGAAAGDAMAAAAAAAGPLQPGSGAPLPLVRYPYSSIGQYVITPEPIKKLVWPLNMSTWQVDSGNTQEHAERAARAMWAALRPERWRLLHATWCTMSAQLEQVQRDLQRLHRRLGCISERSSAVCGRGSSGGGGSSPGSDDVRATASSAPVGLGQQQQQQQQQQQHVKQEAEEPQQLQVKQEAEEQEQRQRSEPAPPSPPGSPYLATDSFATLGDSTAPEYALLAAEVDGVLRRETAISFQICGAFLQLLDPLETAVGFVSSWPYHPQVFVMFNTIFSLGEPGPDTGPNPRGRAKP